MNLYNFAQPLFGDARCFLLAAGISAVDQFYFGRPGDAKPFSHRVTFFLFFFFQVPLPREWSLRCDDVHNHSKFMDQPLSAFIVQRQSDGP